MFKFILPALLTFLPIVQVINLISLKSPIIGIFLFIFVLLLHTILLGAIIPSKHTYFNMITGLSIKLMLTMVLAATWYYLFNLSIPHIAIIIIIEGIIISGFYYLFKTETSNVQTFFKYITFKSQRTYTLVDILVGILILIFLFFTIKSFILLFNAQFTQSLRTPWKVIPKDFLYFYIINTFILIVLSLHTSFHKIQLALISIHYFLTISVALIVYALGYGFDPFIHRATEEVIFQFGQITPKPFYYIGQYALITVFSHLLFIIPQILDFILVPLLFSTLLPPTIYYSLQQTTKIKKNISLVLAVTGLIIPLFLFINTTPQSLANIFIISSIFLFFYLRNLHSQKKIPTLLLIVISLIATAATLTIHPLAGIPLAIFSGLLILHLFTPKKTISKIFKIIIITLYSACCSILLPAVFVLNNFLKKGTITSSFKNYQQFEDSLRPLLAPYALYFKNRYNLFGDLIYFFSHNIPYIILIISSLSIIYIIRKKRFKQFNVFLVTFIILLINYFLLRTVISFDMLIEYERSDFPQRILQIALYFLLPIVLFGIGKLLARIQKLQSFSLEFFYYFIISIMITGSMYTAYPREDGYVYNTGYNVSNADIAAVHFIDHDAELKNINNYIVLSNQTVSVAALQEFGFKKYFKTDTSEELFYYPIPTSSPLYNYYLDMVYNMPSQETINEAANRVGVQDVYFVINKYWARSREIITFAKKQAESWSALDDDQVYVFRYKVKQIDEQPLNQLPTGVQKVY